MTLFYNENSTKLKDALIQNANNEQIYIATAFFSNSDIIKQFMCKKCDVKLIIRLNTGTSPKELEKLIPFIYSGQLEIRFFTDEHFHPKFYIFGGKTAFVGSSNLTNNGIEENQEMNIRIDDKETISHLKNVFDSYWNQAQVLTEDFIINFKRISNEFSTQIENGMAKKIKDTIGNVKYNRNTNQSNYDFKFYCTGEGDHRNYDDYLKYSFISAGQKKSTGYYFSKEIKNLKKGEYFFAYQKRIGNIGGYVGFGKIVEEAVPIDKFLIDGKKLYEYPLKQPNMKENHDNDACEWVVKVEWIKTVSRDNGKFFKGMFTGARHTVCSINKEKHEKTINFLIKEFGL